MGITIRIGQAVLCSNYSTYDVHVPTETDVENFPSCPHDSYTNKFDCKYSTWAAVLKGTGLEELFDVTDGVYKVTQEILAMIRRASHKDEYHQEILRWVEFHMERVLKGPNPAIQFT